MSYSFERLLYISYSTFLGYYIRSQFIEPVVAPFESKEYKFNDFISLHNFEDRKILAFNWQEGKVYILKRYFDDKQFNQSLQIYKKMKMSCLVPFYGEITKNKKYLVFGFPSRGTLREVVTNQNLDFTRCRKIIIQLVFGLAYFNMTGIIPLSITEDNILIDWNYNIFYTDIDESEDNNNPSLEYKSATDLSNVIYTLLTCQHYSTFGPFSQVYQLCKKSEITACDVVSEILNNECFSKDSILIKNLLNELPKEFVTIEPLEDYSIKYLRYNCNDESTLRFIKTIQFDQITIFHFISDRIFIFITGDECVTLINANAKIVNTFLSVIKKSKAVPVEDDDLNTLFEYSKFEFIRNLIEEQQLQVARSKISKIITYMNEFDDKVLISETLALSYVLTHQT